MKMRACGWLLAVGLAVAACGGGVESDPAGGTREPIIVYSGRSEALIAPLLERFSELSGTPVEVRYGETAEMAATLLEEGDGSPAHLFLSQDAGALGALSRAGRLNHLPRSVLDSVAEAFRSPVGDWVGLSGRARTVVYNTEKVRPDELPRSLEEVTDERFKRRFGVAPSNGSFQAHMSAYRAVAGDEASDDLLRGMTANEPVRYPKNSAIVEAVIAGEVDWGLVNHYYLLRALAEDPEAPAANFTMTDGPVASFTNLTGGGLLAGREQALELLQFLLSEEAQLYFASETFEIPLAAGVESATGVAPLTGDETAGVDFAEVSEALPETVVAIQESGLL